MEKENKKYIDVKNRKVENNETINTQSQEKNSAPKSFFGKLKYKFKNRKKWDKKKKIRFVLILLAIIVLSLGVIFATYIYKADGNITTAALNMAADVLGDDSPIFVLVMGVSEDIKVELADTIILFGYNPETQKAFVVSIPRDTFVGTNEAYANGYNKINSLYSKGPGAMAEAVENILGIKIDHYVTVKNTAIPAIVSALGKVEFDVPIDMNYDDSTQNLHIHLKKGFQELDAEGAEQLLRFRHNNDGSSYPSEYGDNDYGRMRTQREFIKVVAKELISRDNLNHLKEVSSAIFDNVETNFKLPTIVGYIPYALKFNVDDLKEQQLPGSSALINELWFYRADSVKAAELGEELLEYLELDEKEYKKYHLATKKTSITTTSSTSTKNDNDVTESTNTSLQNTTSGTSTTHEHSYTSVVTQSPTCTSNGSRTYTCSVCGNSYSEPIEKLGHNYKSTSTVSGNTKTTTYTCVNCGSSYTTTETVSSNQSNNTSVEQSNSNNNSNNNNSGNSNNGSSATETPTSSTETSGNSNANSGGTETPASSGTEQSGETTQTPTETPSTTDNPTPSGETEAPSDSGTTEEQ